MAEAGRQLGVGSAGNSGRGRLACAAASSGPADDQDRTDEQAASAADRGDSRPVGLVERLGRLVEIHHLDDAQIVVGADTTLASTPITASQYQAGLRSRP